MHGPGNPSEIYPLKQRDADLSAFNYAFGEDTLADYVKKLGAEGLFRALRSRIRLGDFPLPDETGWDDWLLLTDAQRNVLIGAALATLEGFYQHIRDLQRRLAR